MQFTLAVAAHASGWEVRLLDAAGQPVPGLPEAQPGLAPARQLARIDLDDLAFPLPPDDDTDGMPAGLAAEDLAETYQALMDRQPLRPRLVELFGRYLFATLIGQAWWRAVVARADNQPIELALCWSADDIALNRLPWEMMHSGNTTDERACAGFLAADPDIAITRRVADTRAERHRVGPLTSPPRVLFAVGASLSDPVVRPGAEYLGLLQHVQHSGRTMHARLLVNATTSSLADAVRAFAPEVVHLICHGQVADIGDGGLTPTLAFRPTGRDAATTAVDLVTAERLFTNLTVAADRARPPVVVINACSTATADELESGRPFAAALVSLGVPIVVGMSGPVTDQACRLFSTGFYGALMDSGEFAFAAARGRRAAIAHGSLDPRSDLDWALPTIFLAEAVPADGRVDVIVDDEHERRVAASLEFSRRPDYPVFCGRWDVLRVYHELLSTSAHRFVAVAMPRADNTDPTNLTQPRLGASWLLKELAGEAIREGHVPILVSKDWLEQDRSPPTAVDFLTNIIKATNRTLQILSRVDRYKDLTTVWNWRYLPRCIRAYPRDPDVADLEHADEFQLYGLGVTDKIARAFVLDFLSLRNAIVARRTPTDDVEPKLVFFFDDCHQLVYSEVLLALLDTYGLRDPRLADCSRGVLAYNERPVEGQQTTIKQIQDWVNAHDVLPLSLSGLHDPIDIEDPLKDPDNFYRAALVYKQFLAHWRRNGTRYPLSFRLTDDAPDVRQFIAFMADLTQGGVPANLCHGDLTNIVWYEARVKPNGILRRADDEDAIKQLAALGAARVSA